MPVKPDIPESRINEACEAARAQKKPNLAKIAREYGVSYGVLRGRHFYKAIKGSDRTLRGEKRILLFDSYSAHFTKEFL
ncbi:transcriptional regulator family: Centromere protein B DNA-binding region [Penicillium sp. IBT 18751x]|nr:transcriptional regulator family: Centromere protein B DNA-binding region [Penicillium sp. IBT 18751x]